VSFWASLRWAREDRVLRAEDLTDDCADTLGRLIAAYVDGVANEYSLGIPDGIGRFQGLVRHLEQSETLPTPVVLLKERTGLMVVDGFHRLAALFYCSGQASDPPEDLKRRANLLAKRAQPVWMGLLTNHPTNPRTH
jgi:hypothetical protein